MFMMLLRQDPIMRSLCWKFVVLLGVSSTFLTGLIVYITQGIENSQHANTLAYSMLLAIIWATAGIFHLIPASRTRCNAMMMTLPISAGKLWAAHLAALLLSQISIILITAAMLFILNLTLGQALEGSPILQADLGMLTVSLIGGTLLLSTIIQTISINQQRPVFQETHLGGLFFFWIIILAIMLLCPLLPALVSIFPITAFLLYRHTRGRIAAVFELTVSPSKEGPTASIASIKSAPTTPSRAWWIQTYTILKSLNNRLGVTVWVFFPFLFGFGLILSGCYPWFIENDMRLVYVPMACYMIIVFFMPMANRLYTLEPFPLSRNRIFALMVLPGFLFLGMGYGAGSILTASRLEKEALVEYKRKRNGSYALTVPLVLCKTAKVGAIPMNTSPWGESHEPWKTTYFKGSNQVLYSPYSITKDSTSKFIALQLSRAIKAAYHTSIPPEDLESRYFKTGEDGSVTLKGATLNLLKDFPQLHAAPQASIFPSLLAVISLISMLTIIICSRGIRASTSDRQRKNQFWLIAGTLLFLHILPFPLTIAGIFDINTFGALFQKWVNHMTENIPIFTLLHWSGGILAAALAYRISLKHFKKVEAVPPRCGEKPMSVTPLLDFFQK